jgi:hypothetical protein
VLHLVGLANIGLHRQRAAAGGSHFVGHPCAAVAVDVRNDHARAFLGHAQGGGPANAGGAASDDRDPVVEPAHA